MLTQIDSSALKNLETVATPKISKASTLGEIISKLVPYFFYFAGVLLLLYLILGGFQLMLSRGDPKAAQAGKSKITSAVIGFVIVFVAYWIMQIIANVFGIEVIKETFGPVPALNPMRIINQ